jgi:hypothetical protein
MHGSMKVMVVGIVLGYACEAQPEGALLLQIDRGVDICTLLLHPGIAG